MPRVDLITLEPIEQLIECLGPFVLYKYAGRNSLVRRSTKTG